MVEIGRSGVVNLLSFIPTPYKLGIIAALVIGAAITLRIEWQHSVKAAADKVINAYIATQQKDANDLAAIETKTNTKIVIQYQDRVQVITKQVAGETQVIEKIVHDNEQLSPAWICVHNAAVTGRDVSKCQ
jgi:hypothetical protein